MDGQVTSKEYISKPTHVQHSTSLQSVELFSGTSVSEAEIKSRLAGTEIDLKSPVMYLTGPNCNTVALDVQGDADSKTDSTKLCATNYISDMTSQSVIGEDIPGREKVSEKNTQKGTNSSLTEEISCTSSYEKWKKLSGPMILFLLLGLVFIVWGRSHLLQLVQWLEHLPLCLSLLVFIVLFTLVSFPFGFGYIILNMMAGYLYGMVHGQLIVMLSVNIGITFSFVLCRLWFKDYARSVVTSNALQAVLRVLEGPHGFKVIFLTRFTPIPFGLQNVLFAMTTVSYPQYLLASILGLFPTQILNTYMGSTIRNMQEVLTDRMNSYIILGVQVIISIFLMLYILNKARRELAKLTQNMDMESGNSDNR